MQNILFVDDDVDMLILMKRSLSAYGYHVTTLADPSKFVESIARVQPAIIILDINMGEWDGREICKKLKTSSSNTHIPVILCSALVDGSLSLEDCKANLFLPKPLTAKQLAGHLKILA